MVDVNSKQYGKDEVVRTKYQEESENQNTKTSAKITTKYGRDGQRKTILIQKILPFKLVWVKSFIQMVLRVFLTKMKN